MQSGRLTVVTMARGTAFRKLVPAVMMQMATSHVLPRHGYVLPRLLLCLKLTIAHNLSSCKLTTKRPGKISVPHPSHSLQSGGLADFGTDGMLFDCFIIIKTTSVSKKRCLIVLMTVLVMMRSVWAAVYVLPNVG